MDTILVRCKMCKHAMKFAVAKAGKRAKCPKCDAIIVIKAEEEAKKPEPAAEAVAAGPAPAAPTPPTDEEEDAGGSYGVNIDHELEASQEALRQAEEEARKRREKKKNLPKVGRKTRAIADADAWNSIRTGMMCIFIGSILAFIAHLLLGSYVLIGSNEFPEYAVLLGDHLSKRGGEADFPAPGRFWDVDELGIHLGMIAGRDFTGYARTCLIIASILTFLQSLLSAAGYFFFLPVPRRFGMFGQTLMMLALVVFNLILAFFFKLLPVVGAHGYILIPYLTPEIVMVEYNMERTVPISVIWSGAPFWENMLNLLLRCGQYFEPMFVCIFVWSAGDAIKEKSVAARGRGMTELILGTFFTYLCFALLSLCGASPALVYVLRVIYGFWFALMAMFFLSYAAMLMSVRAALYEKIHPKNELIEKKKKDDDDDDEDDDDEDDDDDD